MSIRYFIVLGFLSFYLSLFSQDLIERAQLAMPAMNDSSPSIVADQIYMKSGLKSIRPFKLESKHTSKDGFNAIYLSLNKSTVKSMNTNEEMQLDIPVGEGNFVSLLMYPYDIRSAGYKCTTAGDSIESKGSISFFRGAVSDDPSSSAHLTIINDKIQIVISDRYGNYNVGMLEDNSGYVFFNDMELGDMPFECGSDEGYAIVNDQSIEVKEVKEKNGACIKVYVEVDYSSYKNFGSDVFAAESFALAAFGEVATIYANAGVPIEVSEVKVWTSDDPYNGETNVSNALNYLASNVSAFNGDLFHLISAKNSNSFGGIAFLSCRGSGPCKATTIGTGIPFAVSQTSTSYRSYPTYSWTVNVLAHEMGHNMGAPHTQACVWGANDNTAIDGCATIEGNCGNPGLPTVGSIMSYCHYYQNIGISLIEGFGSEVGAHIYSEYQYVSTRFLGPCVSEEESISGCMVQDDHNYNPEATIDDGSCLGTCNDGIQNADETGIDCGGILCSPCQEFGCAEISTLSSNHVVNFEQGIGIFEQLEGSDDVDWTIKTGGTPSGNTGPDGAAQGDYYIYIEASGTNSPSKRAILQSACIDLSQQSKPILIFNYHMYGSGMGSLSVNAILDKNQTIELWSQAGNQGSQWREVQVDLSSIKSQIFKLEIIGTTGSSFRSDIALDAISFIDSDIEQCDADNLNINTAIDISNSKIDRIKNSISTVAPVTVMDGAELVWQAGSEIEINATFEIKAGASVILQTADCNN